MNSKKLIYTLGFLYIAWLSYADSSYAQEDSTPDQITKKIESLEKEINELKHELQTYVRGQDKLSALEPRVDELETLAIETNEAIGDRAIPQVFDAISLDIGGFLHTQTSIVRGEDNTSFAPNNQILELLVHADLSEKWDLFFAQAFVRNAALVFTDEEGIRNPEFQNNNSPIATGTVLAWSQYKHSDAFNVQVGRYITPIGIINREHFPALLLDTVQPLFLQPFPGQSLFANFNNGFNIYGSKFVGKERQNKLEYFAFAGAFSGNATSLNGGGRLQYTFAKNKITLGSSLYSGDRDRLIDNDRFLVSGLDLRIDSGPLLFKAEAYFSNENLNSDKIAFYAQPAWRLQPNLIAFYRFDYFDNGSAAIPRNEHVLGLVYNPIDLVRLRAIYRRGSFSDELGINTANTDKFQFQSTISF